MINKLRIFILKKITTLFFLTISIFISAGFNVTGKTAAARTCTPPVLGSYDTPGVAVALYISGNTAYVADGNSGIQIVNVSDPINPKLLGNYDTPGAAIALSLSGGTVCVADANRGLQIIDVHNPKSPVLLGNYDTSGDAYGISYSGNTVYIADGSDGLQVIGVDNPKEPELTGSFDTPDWAQGITIYETSVYVADRGSGLQIIDVESCQDEECGCPNDTLAPTGCISGKVVDAEKIPMEKEVVSLRKTSPLKPLIKKTAETDTNGCYHFKNLRNGIYKVRVNPALVEAQNP